MKKTLLLVFCILTGLGAMAADGEKATDAVKNMGIGWNLGNTFDAVNWEGTGGWNWSSPTEHENGWQQPVTKPELLKMMKEAGFGAIRVPVTWFQEMDASGKVNDAFMKRVHEVVDYVIDNGMYCILNVHHDTGAHNLHWLVADEDVYASSKDRYEYLWKQIATEFKDYGDKLLFESYNEMLDKVNSWCFASFASSPGYDAAIAASAYNAINSYAQSFVNTVRQTGGNNATRNLVVNTYGACSGSGTWNTHLKDPLKEMKLPTDVTENHLIFQIHAYPNIAKDAGSQLVDRPMSEIKTELDDMFEALNTHLKGKGAPVIIGEWGTGKVDEQKYPNQNDYAQRKPLMLEFAEYFVKKAKEYEFAPFYWMGLTDGAYRSMPAFHQPDLAETIVKAYYGSSFTGKYPTEADFTTEYTVKFDSDWAELFLYGDWTSSSPLKVNEYQGIRVEMDNDSYASKLQVKVYGDLNGKNADGSDKYKEQYTPLTAGSATSTIDFDAAQLGSNIYRITLQTSAGALTAKVKGATLIKKDGTETPGSIQVAWGCSLTAETSPKTTGLQGIAYEGSETDAFYSLSGQRVKTPTKGIYIRNGKKVIVR